MSSRKKTSQKSNISYFFVWTGLIFIVIAFIIFCLTFYPVIRDELRYFFKHTARITASKQKPKEIIPLDTDFGIVIPKIEANAKVVPNVNPYNEKEYQWALTKGVAHAVSTAFPGHAGNSFIFAHSSENWYIANQYNSIFYLLDKLEKGDEVDLYYKNTKYVYKVTEKKLVNANDVQYMKNTSAVPTVTLMTCWPPGTTLKRLIVVAQISP